MFPASRSTKQLSSTLQRSLSYAAQRLLYPQPATFVKKQPRGEEQSRRPPPTPYETSQRLIAAASLGQLNKAIEIVKQSALDSQSTSVWNTLLKQILVAERYRLSYDVFTDMKRRGFKPNLRTFHTLLSGYAKAPAAALTQGTMERAQNIYNQYKLYCDQLPTGGLQQSLTTPTNDYLRILAKSGQYEAMFEVFRDMPSTGRLSPDLVTFTELVNAIRHRKAPHAAPGHALASTEANIALRNAEDVGTLWKGLVGASEKQGFRIDAYAAAPTIFALARGSAASQEQAFSIVHDYIGFSPDTETKPKPRKIALSSQLLTSVLELCAVTKSHERCVHYAKSVMAEPSGREFRVLQSSHMIIALQSLAALSTPQSQGVARQALEFIQWMLQEEVKGGWRRELRPDINAYFQAFLACRREEDWATACGLFELMSGYHVSDFERPLVPPELRGCSAPSNHGLPARFEVLPDPGIMNLMARAAVLSSSSGSGGIFPQRAGRAISDFGPIYIALRIITHLGTDHFFRSLPASRIAQAMDASWSYRERRMNQRRLATTILDLHECVAPLGGATLVEAEVSNPSAYVLPPTSEELQQWKLVKEAALQFVKSAVRRAKQLSRTDGQGQQLEASNRYNRSVGTLQR